MGLGCIYVYFFVFACVCICVKLINRRGCQSGRTFKELKRGDVGRAKKDKKNKCCHTVFNENYIRNEIKFSREYTPVGKVGKISLNIASFLFWLSESTSFYSFFLILHPDSLLFIIPSPTSYLPTPQIHSSSVSDTERLPKGINKA